MTLERRLRCEIENMRLPNSPDYKVDGRVSIGMDALDDEQKHAVEGIISDRAQFLKSASETGKVQRISKEQPLYSLKVSAGLRIIYSQNGDEIVVMDLMQQATLDWFRRQGAKAKNGRRKKVRATPNAKKAI